MTLWFNVEELKREGQEFANIAASFLAPGSRQVIETVLSSLDGIARSRDGGRWQISHTNPIRTRVSAGEYMPDGKGSLAAFAEITFVWHLQPIRRKGRSGMAENVALSGIASSKIRIIDNAPPHDELAMWRMEIADRAAPGAFFHTQILGREDDYVFPHTLDVPRLPGVFSSPFSCMEFVLGEMFQDSWARESAKESAPMTQWRAIQARRHRQHLEWVLKTIDSASGSPWSAWKAAKPHEGLFLKATRR